MKHLALAAVMSALTLTAALGGCASTPATSQDSETAYVVAATAADIFVTSGKATGDAISQVCTGDKAAYKILVATRSTLSPVNYAPADAAHATLQTDGAKLSGSCSL